MLILDFDGTMTDAEREGKPFTAGYLEDLAVLTGRSLDDITTMAQRFEEEIATDPDRHGWLYDGHIVAPASVDPYLRIMPVARKIFDACDSFPRAVDRARLLDGILFKYNYRKTDTAFRQGAYEVLAELRDEQPYVVTNSHTRPVQTKIRNLAQEAGAPDSMNWLIERVYGRAKKYVIDDRFTEVDEYLDVPGLSRPVLLRRRYYHDVISTLLSESGQSWSDLLIVGDIFELDLALPLAMGARVGLVENDFTPGYEIEYVSAHPRGHVMKDIAAIPELVAQG